jgi:hypothetical protein
MKMAKIGVLVERSAAERRWKYGVNTFHSYIEEILGHAGIPYSSIDQASKWKNSDFDILIAALTHEDDNSLNSLLDYVNNGGVLIAYGGLNRLAGKVGCLTNPLIHIGYAECPELLKGDTRFLEANTWTPLDQTDAVMKSWGRLHRNQPEGPEAGPLLLHIPLGKGEIIRWSVAVPETVVALQQGSGPVIEDGIAAHDGTGSLDEGILKADDRCEMDWQLDRHTTETGVPYYALPYGDWWREAAIGHLIRTAGDLGLTLPFLGYWPSGTKHVALISHDSDMNMDESAVQTMNVLKECGVRSTWCMLEPGYGLVVHERIREEGHELAFHYNALTQDGGAWSEADFARQLAAVQSLTGAERLVSNKNHYTRYEGWGELFQWCETCGIEADQTRGPSKKGNIGFLFGTCHPYFPIAWHDEHNRMYNVLEVGFLTQDLDHPTLADTSVIVPFLEQVMAVEGVAHFLFHQVHVLRLPKVADALRLLVKEAKQRGFEFWTCKEVNDWERARRKHRILGMENGRAVLEGSLEGAVVWVPVPARGSESLSGLTTEIRFGVPCIKQVATQA